jgi:dienelactone hydrolase
MRPYARRRFALRHLPLVLALSPSFVVPEAVEAAGRKVTIPAPDGVELAATHFAAAKPGPGVVLLHMCNSDRSAWNSLGEKLAAAGIHAVALDYRGYGESGGARHENPVEQQRNIDANWPGDVDAAFAFLAAQAGVDATRIGAAGGSCGVNQAVHFARRHPEQVRTLVLLAGNANRAGEDYLAASSWMPLLAAGARDDGAADETMAWLLGFSGNPDNVLKRYDSGGHGTELFATHAELEPAIVDWFVRYLVREPRSRADAAAAPPERPSLALWQEMREPGGAARLRQRSAAAEREGRSLPMPPEGPVNVLGYELSQAGRHDDAIEVFRLNTELHPDSANAWDSLSDGYLAAGRRDEALAAVRRVLELLPADPAADSAFEKQLREIAVGKLAAPPADPAAD